MKEIFPAILDSDLDKPDVWLESLNDDQLFYWLEKAISEGDTLPIIVPLWTDFVSELSRLIRNRTSNELRKKFCRVVQNLLRFWARRDSASLLDDLLTIAGRLRCVNAKVDIIIIARERLEEHPEEIKLRQLCLSTLAGFGPDPSSLPLFYSYIDKPKYTPICYRALYRYDLENAIEELPKLLQYFEDEDIRILKIMLKVFMRDYIKDQPRQQLYFIEKVFIKIKSNSTSFRKFYMLISEIGFGFDFRVYKDALALAVIDKYINNNVIGSISNGDIVKNIDNILDETVDMEYCMKSYISEIKLEMIIPFGDINEKSHL